MKHGFICFGDTGRMQIDGTNIALGLIRKQSFHCPKVQDAGQGTIKEVYFPTKVHQSSSENTNDRSQSIILGQNRRSGV